MLALWSRAARNQGTCRCIQCVSNTTGLAKRPGAVGIKNPRIWKPTSTFVYTTIFAAGLAIDGRAKRKRNEQWDAAFEHLREELARKPATQEHIIADEESVHDSPLLSLEQVWPEGVDWEFLYRAAGNELTDDRVLSKMQAEMLPEPDTGDWWELLAADSRFPGAQTLIWPVNTGRPLVRHNLPPQSLWSLDNVREKALRNRHSWKKLAIQELVIGRLIISLLDPARQSSLVEDELAQLSPALRGILELDDQAVRDLQSEMVGDIFQLELTSKDAPAKEVFQIRTLLDDYTKPRYVQDPDGEFYQICYRMNETIKGCFGKMDPKPNPQEMASSLARIAHNLLVSSAPPDVQTFNILITGLKRWNMSLMVDRVINALGKSKVRPNELTCAIILDHYVRVNEPEKFSRFVERMRGVGNALMMANPDIIINEAGGGRLVRVSEKKVYQKVYPTPMVFNSLMHGVLRFAGIERALEIYYEMKSDGWGLDVLGLTQFLVECLRRSDWTNGVYIWEEISSIKKFANKEHMAKAYANMLSLCSVTGNTAAFNQLLIEVSKLGIGVDKKQMLQAVFSLTDKLRKEQESSKPELPVAPAWAADNLLIAVSAYMDGAAPRDQNPSSDRDASAELEALANSNRNHKADLLTSATEPDPLPAKSPEDAWQAWLDHELSLKKTIQDIPGPEQAKGDLQRELGVPTPEITPDPLPAKSPDAAWAAWVEHELGMRKGAGANRMSESPEPHGAEEDHRRNYGERK